MSQSPTTPVLAVQELSRQFPGVLALDSVHFDILPGEIHALCGENGTGKSTLINILAGVQRPSSGKVLIDGCPIVLQDPIQSQKAGISVIFQEFNLLPHLSVAENVFINREPRVGPIIDWRTINHKTRQILESLNQDMDPGMSVNELAVGQRQLVEIARASLHGCARYHHG